MADKEFKLLSVQFDKILVEKNPSFKDKLPEITSNIDIKNIEKEKVSLIDKEPLKVEFIFSLKFGDLGKLEMGGRVLFLLDKESEESALKEWKSKKLPENLRLIILNLILQKSTLKALQLEEEIGLPFHIQLPRLQIQKSDESSKKD
jgi:hypothetical protein